MVEILEILNFSFKGERLDGWITQELDVISVLPALSTSCLLQVKLKS